MDQTSARRPPSLSPELLGQLIAIVGPAGAITESRDQAPYLREWRGLWRGTTPVVLRPRSTSEVAAILKLAFEHSLAVVPQGGNTGLVGGQIPGPGRGQIVLSLGRLDRIRTIDPDGNTITVEAGVTLQRVQEAADMANRLFPLSLASQGSCQIGGNLSTNAGGVGVLAYGNAKDLVLGLEVVLADGRIWNGLRALRKDNTGYDLKQLFLGTEGTLGIITAAVLKLYPKPREIVSCFAGLPSLEAARAFFEQARQAAGPMLTAFEVMPRLALDFVLRHVPGTRDPVASRHAWYVLLDISGFTEEGAATALAERLFTEAIGAGTVEDATIAASGQQSADFWRIRETLPDTQKLEGGSIKHDVSVPVAAMPDLVARGNAAIERILPGTRPLPFGHFGDGNLHYNLSQPIGMDEAAFLAQKDRLSAAIYTIVVDLGGSISAEHGVGVLKREELVAFEGEVGMDLMRAVKHALDPKGILNPGKVLGP